MPCPLKRRAAAEGVAQKTKGLNPACHSGPSGSVSQRWIRRRAISDSLRPCPFSQDPLPSGGQALHRKSEKGQSARVQAGRGKQAPAAQAGPPARRWGLRLSRLGDRGIEEPQSPGEPAFGLASSFAGSA